MPEKVSDENQSHSQSDVEQRYKCLLGTLPGVMYALDEKGIFTFVSERAGPVLGFTRDDLVGKHFSTIVHPLDLPSVSREYLLPRFQGIPTGNDRAPKLFDERRSWPRRTNGLQVRLQRGDTRKENAGEVVACKVNASGQYNDAHEFCGTVGVIYDVVDEEVKPFSVNRLKRYNAFDLLTNAILHVFSNVFTGIYGNLQLIEMQLENRNDFANNFEAIKQSIENVVALVKKLSCTVNTQEGTDICNLNEILNNEAEELLAGPGRSYTSTVADDIWRPQIDADYTRHIVRAILFHIAQSVCSDCVVTIHAENLAESPVKLPRIDCAYIGVAFTYFETGNTDVQNSNNQSATFERIASMALSYELLKKIGGYVTLTHDNDETKILLYLPAIAVR